MSETTRQIALGALHSARGAIARVNPARDPEDAAADLIEVWGSVETALRALLNGSTLSGQDLVREVRKREMISLTLTHSLLDLLAVRERLNDTGYKPVASDVETASRAVAQLDDALSESSVGIAAAAAAAGAQTPDAAQVRSQPVPPPVVPPASAGDRAPRNRVWARIPTWGWVAVAVLAVAAAGAAIFLTIGAGDELDAGRTALREGRREAARAEFERVARENPRSAEAHLFLARMEREEKDFASARDHAAAAIRADTSSALAYREMGAILYVTGNYDAARRFLVRAVARNAQDPTANGLLGCALIQLGRPTDAERFFTRAGPGPWRDCRGVSG
ncbi:MAG TPA: tetratricopeptide repeat protein [Gemmatimonadaceae bacterium]